jgi:hypothetical protein
MDRGQVDAHSAVYIMNGSVIAAPINVPTPAQQRLFSVPERTTDGVSSMETPRKVSEATSMIDSC